MTEKPRVLVVDNDADMRSMLAFRLAIAGYAVCAAASRAEALELLQREVIHMAVLDVRLEDDGRPGDQSGLDLVRHLPDYIPYVAFTAYEDIPTLKYAQEVGSRTLSKASDDAVPRLLELLAAYRAEARINLDLRIRARTDLEEAVRQIVIPGAPAAAAPSGADLICILQRLFYNADEIEVDVLPPATRGPALAQPGSLLLLVWPHHPANGRAEPVVVRCGDAEEVRQERQGYDAFEPYLRGKRCTSLRDTAYSRQLGAAVYALIDGDKLDMTGVFDDVFLEHDAAYTIALLERFFALLEPMFVNAQLETVDLTTLYLAALRMTPQQLDAALRMLHPREVGEPQLRLRGLRDPQLNPLLWLRQGDGLRRFTAHTRVGLCHGVMHGRNLLVDDKGHFWPINFSRVGRNHMLYDFAALEADLKFSLLPVVDLGELLLFERALLAPARFGEPLPEREAGGAQLDKAFRVVGALRRMAAEHLKLGGDLREYYQALLFHTLHVILMPQVGDAKKEHALLAASLICQRLSAWPYWEFTPPPPPPAPPPDAPEAQPTLAARVTGMVAFMSAGALVAMVVLTALSYLNPSWQQQLMALVVLALLIIAAFGVAGLVSGATVVTALGQILARLMGASAPRPPDAPS